MEAEGHNTTKVKLGKKKISFWILSIIVLLLLLFMSLFPVFLSSDAGNRRILSKLNSSISAEVGFSDLSVGWLRGIEVSDFSFKDENEGILALIEKVSTKPHYFSLLGGSLSFGKTVLERPRVEIDLQSLRPKTSVSEKSAAKSPDRHRDSTGNSVRLPLKRIDLQVNDGEVDIIERPDNRVELSDIQSQINLRPAGRQTEFAMDMDVSGAEESSRLKSEGKITPDKEHGWSLKGASGNISLETDELELESLGPILALAGIDIKGKGKISSQFDGELIDGRVKKLSGTVKGEDLYVSGGILKGDSLSSDSLGLEIKVTGEDNLLQIETFQLATDWLKADVGGVIPTDFGSLTEFVSASSGYELNGNVECDIGSLLSQMPRTLGLKEDTLMTSGRIDARLEASSEGGTRSIKADGMLYDLAGEIDGRQISVSKPVKAQARITSSKEGVSFEKIGLDASFGKLSGSGTSELIEYNAEFDFGKLQEEFGAFISTGEYSIESKISSNGKISLDGKVSATGKADIEGFRIRKGLKDSAGFESGSVDFSITAIPKEGSIDIETLQASSNLGQVNITEGSYKTDEQKGSKLNLLVKADIKLDEAKPFVVLFKPEFKGMELAGKAVADINLNKKGKVLDFSSPSATINNLAVKYPGRQTFEEKEVKISSSGQLNLLEKTYKLKWELLSGHIKTSGDVTKTVDAKVNNLEGKANFEYEWSKLLTLAGAYVPRGLNIKGERKDSFSFSSEYPVDESGKMLSNMNARGSVGFESVEYAGLKVEPTDVNISVDSGDMQIGPVFTTVNKGDVNMIASIAFKGEVPALESKRIELKNVEINDETARKFLMFLNPIFARSTNVAGTANFLSNYVRMPLGKALTKEMILQGRISAENVRIGASDFVGQLLSLAGGGTRQQRIRIHPTDFVVKDGFVRYDNMQVDIGDNPMNFKDARIGLNGGYDMKVVLPWTFAGRTVKVGREQEGQRIEITLKTRPGEKPELDTSAILKGAGRQLLQEKAGELLKDLFK